MPTERAAARSYRAPAAAVEFSPALDQDLVSVLYSYSHGLGEFVLPATMLEALRPTGERLTQADLAAMQAHRTRAAETFLLDNHTRRVASVQLTGRAAATRFWVALSTDDPLTSEDQRRLEASLGTRPRR